LRRTGQVGRSGVLGAGVLRHQAVADSQGRDDRNGADGRPERVDTAAAAGPLSRNVRNARRRTRAHVADLRVADGRRRGRGRTLWAEQAYRGREKLPQHLEGEHDPQRVASGDQRRSGNLSGHRGRPVADVRTGYRAADGATLFSILTMRTLDKLLAPHLKLAPVLVK